MTTLSNGYDPCPRLHFLSLGSVAHIRLPHCDRNLERWIQIYHHEDTREQQAWICRDQLKDQKSSNVDSIIQHEVSPATTESANTS